VLIELKTSCLKVTVDVENGARLVRLCAGDTDENWLFYEPERAIGYPVGHSVYDDVWVGGFEELFPNDAPVHFDGRALPDHGELWNARFDVVELSEAAVILRRECVTVPAAIEKRIMLSESGATLRMTYQLNNMSAERLWYLFKLHPAMRVERGDMILLPGGQVTPVSPGFGVLDDTRPLPWPVAVYKGQPLRLDLVREEESGFREFVYVSALHEGWCGIHRARTGERIRLRYDQAVFPYCWLFITYGGWRGYNVVVLEPCTNVPKDLAEARAMGSCAELAPGEVKSLHVAVEVESR